MDIKQIVEGYSVSPQLTPSDMAALAQMGVTTVICNRPDSEVPYDLQAAVMQEAAEAEGLSFVYNPVIGLDVPLDAVDEQSNATEGSEGLVVAYCGSGLRSAVVWAFAQAGTMPVDEILSIAADAGYRMDHLAGVIKGIAEARG